MFFDYYSDEWFILEAHIGHWVFARGKQELHSEESCSLTIKVMSGLFKRHILAIGCLQGANRKNTTDSIVLKLLQ